MKAVKSLLIKSAPNGRIDSEAFLQGLLEWRNTPKAHGMSPSEIVFGHPLRSLVPAHHESYSSKWKDIMDRRESAAEEEGRKVKRQYDQHARKLKPFKIGAPVRIQNPDSKHWDKCGIIISVGRNRDYRVKLPSGRVYWRNRRFLRTDYSRDSSQQESPVSTAPPAVSMKIPNKKQRGPVRFAEMPVQEETARRSSRKIKSPNRLNL